MEQDMKGVAIAYDRFVDEMKLRQEQLANQRRGKVLVCVIGSLRAADLTWGSFVQHVLKPLDADLLVLTDEESLEKKSDMGNACIPLPTVGKRYTAMYQNPPEGRWDLVLDDIARGVQWRCLTAIPGNWLGGAFNRAGAGAILIALRHWLWQQISSRELLNWYDTIVVTRSDYFYVSDHPLPPRDERGDVLERIWVPEGEDYGGICDRHVMLCGPRMVFPAISIMEHPLKHPQIFEDQLREEKRWGMDLNVETMLKLAWKRHNVWDKVMRFPRIQYLIAEGADAPTRWSKPVWDARVGQWVKYPSEVNDVLRNVSSGRI